jgi:hypothetical protein
MSVKAAGGGSTDGLDHDGGAVAEHLGRTHHWAGVVANAYHAVRSDFARVGEHQLKRFLSRRFTEIRENTDASAK